MFSNRKDKVWVTLPRFYRRLSHQKAKLVLRRIQNNPKILDWNDRGELK